MGERLQRTWLAGLVIITAGAVAQVAVFPRWPISESMAHPPGALAGTRWQLVGERAGPRSLQRALGPSRRFVLAAESTSSSPPITLTLTAVATRRHQDLQVAALTASDPELRLTHRRLIPTVSGEAALGRIEDRPALQACLVSGHRSGVTQQTLVPLAERPPKALADRLSQLLEMRPLGSYRCQLATLELRGDPRAVTPDDTKEALAWWNKLVPKLPL